MTIHDMLQMLVDQNGSDLHVVSGSAPTLRIDGRLVPVPETSSLSKEQTLKLIEPILTKEQKDYVDVNKEIDFALPFKEKARFRVNVYFAQGSVSAAFRFIPQDIRSIDELQLPPLFHTFTQYRQGLVLLTGPTGEGKSTTLAAMIDEINQTRAAH